MEVKLRDYQLLGIDNIMKAWEDCRSVLFQMPTGTGKTTLFCELVRKFTKELYPTQKVLIITHRKELVEQAFNRLVSDFHLTTGAISSNFISNYSAQIQVASIQTLVRRVEHQKDIFSLVIIDEAHHALASTYRQLWNYYPSAKFLGVTATPTRTNGQGFQDLFDKIVVSNSIKWFIKNNHLADTRYYANHTPDVSNIKLKAGDYDETELSEIMQDNSVMADLVQSYRDFADEKKIIVFAVNRAHSNKIVEKYISCGYSAKSIDTYTSSEERQKIVQDFRDNKFKILCNVNIFTEGFDCPDVDAVQLARPTKSLTLFLQQVGRCMRPHKNKIYGIVLDNAGLWKEHGLPKMDREWILNGHDKSICHSQKEIIGIPEVSGKENNEPQESKSLRLVEVGELDISTLTKTISYNKIEENLIDNKIVTMRERIETLVKKIHKFEQLKANETDEEDIKIFEGNIKKFKEELYNLQEKLQPQRFEQVIELIISNCQELIGNNEIFVDGDKDEFLKKFVEPYLKNESLNDFQTKSPRKITPNYKPFEGTLEVYHKFPKSNFIAKGKFDLKTKSIEYNGVIYKSASKAAINVNQEISGVISSLNGWRFWNYIDESGNENPIGNLRLK
jgi:superfamily II DNA or RNA helicase